MQLNFKFTKSSCNPLAGFMATFLFAFLELNGRQDKRRPLLETLIAFWKGVKLLNCSNNIATDIDMCHLICIIQHTHTHTNRKEDPTLMRKNELAKYWQDLGIVKARKEKGKILAYKLQKQPRPFPLSVCLCFCKFIDNWQFEMATKQKTGVAFDFRHMRVYEPNPYWLCHSWREPLIQDPKKKKQEKTQASCQGRIAKKKNIAKKWNNNNRETRLRTIDNDLMTL